MAELRNRFRFTLEPGRNEIYARRLGADGQWQVSTDGGHEPRWAPDGLALFYKEGDGDFFEVPFDPGGGGPMGRPRLLFSIPDASFHGYDVASDGRFLVARNLASNHPVSQLHLVLNWNTGSGN